MRILVDFWPASRIDRIDGFHIGDVQVFCLVYFLAPPFFWAFRDADVVKRYNVVWWRCRHCHMHAFRYGNRSRGEISYKDVKRLVRYNFQDAFGSMRSAFLCDIQMWVDREEIRGGSCDENRRLAEWRYDAMSRRLSWI